MPYKDTIQSFIQLATTASTAANFGSLVFATTNAYFANRLKGYPSFDAVMEDPAIPSDSTAYKALQLASAVSGGAATPFYIGRREWDDITLTANVKDSTDYRVVFVTFNETTFEEVRYDVKFTSDTDATGAEISAGLKAAFDALTPVGVTLTDNLDGTLTADKTAGYGLYMENLTELVDTYTTTESAADLLSALIEEGTEDFYFVGCDDHTETFVTAMATAVEATGSTNFPKMYIVATQEATSLQTLPEPAVDILGKLKELGFDRTMASWHDKADSIFPEVVLPAFNGKFTPGSTTYKFVRKPGGMTNALDPATGKALSKTKVGYILDRNANVFTAERGVSFNHEGHVSSGEWIDNIIGRDYLQDRQEVVLLDYLVNLPGSKSSFTKGDLTVIKGLLDGTMEDAVGYKFLKGYDPTFIPDTISFTDQANRLLQNVVTKGYLAGAIHNVVINGTLTYSEDV